MRDRAFSLSALVCLFACPWAQAGSGDVPASRPSGTAGPTAMHAHRRPEVISPLGVALYADPAGADRAKLEADLASARAELGADPDDPDKLIWVGRRLGYLWRMREAIEVYSKGIEKFPDYAPLYRHRGHRYISVRQFDKAVADLEKAAALIEGKPDRIEPDGMPNKLNIPLTTTAFNVWYHLGLAHYLKGDFERALRVYKHTMKYSRRYDDNLVATTHWMYMTLRRLGRDREAAALLEPIRADMRIIENSAYHRLTLMYKGLIEPSDLLDELGTSALDSATTGYGVGNWFYYNGDAKRATVIFERVVSGKSWPAFGYIAAEVDLTPMRAR